MTPIDTYKEIQAMSEKVDVLNILPLDDADEDAPDEILSAWMPGDIKPLKEGPYIRIFEEGEGLSWWYNDRWNMDSFFAGPSDIQNATWRGISAQALHKFQGEA